MNYVQKLKRQLQENEIVITRTIDDLEFAVERVNEELRKTTRAESILFLEEVKGVLQNEIKFLQNALNEKPVDL